VDPRLLAAVGRDPGRINFDPARRDRLMRQHGL
jgi:alkane 1-monooxygenase